MCGIAGLLGLGMNKPGYDSLMRMILVQQHRGPDGQGVFLDGPVGLGHARLSIIDPQGGHQPMHLPETGLAITFNGEIFNYIELREELLAKGHKFVTLSDTEVVLRLFHEYGPSGVKKMNGQWAFAIWDSRRRSLFLSRDRAGIRPLFYTVQSGFFGFASEAKALLSLPFISRKIDSRALAETFVFWHPLPPRSIFEGISVLPPGHNLAIGLDRPQPEIRSYWQIRYEQKNKYADDENYFQELKSLIADATRLMLRADVPVGAYLSGGLDSSVTTAAICGNDHAAFRTFSVGFSDHRYDESAYQSEVSDFLGTKHESVTCRNGDIGRVFPRVVWHAEQPIVRTAPAPLFLLSQLVRQSGMKVVLTGEGADEVLGGYDIFKEAKIRRFCSRYPDSKWRPLLLKRLYPYMENIQKQSASYLKTFFRISPEAVLNPLSSHLPRWELGANNILFLSDEVRAELGGWNYSAELKNRLPAEFDGWDWFSRAQYLEFSFLMPGYILSAQGDRMALAHGVESRFPFLDHRIIEFGAGLPLRLRMNGLVEKYALKKAARGLIPESVIRRTKQPYRAPGTASFTGPNMIEPAYLGEIMSEERLKAQRLFNPKAVALLVQKARQGRVLGVRDDMAFVGVLSGQLLAEQFLGASPSIMN